MADNDITEVTDVAAPELTLPVETDTANQVEADAAADADVASTTDADDAADPKKLRQQVAGFKGTVTQQAKELRELKAKMAELETVSKEAATARAELERIRSEQAQVTLRNQAQYEMSQRVSALVADYAQELDQAGVYDEQARNKLLKRYQDAEWGKEVERYQRANVDTQLNETAKQRQQREYHEQAISARDKVVAREAAKLTKQLKGVGIEREITPGELIARLKQDVTSNTALDELQDVAEAAFDAAVADEKKARRAAGIADRDANGVDVFERGGTPTLSPQTILDRWSEGAQDITYAMAKAAEQALSRR